MFVFLLFSAQLYLSICQMFLAVFFFHFIHTDYRSNYCVCFCWYLSCFVVYFAHLFLFIMCSLTFVWGYGVVCVYIFIVLFVFVSLCSEYSSYTTHTMSHNIHTFILIPKEKCSARSSVAI